MYIKEDLLTKVVNCEEVESEPDLYKTYLKNCTEADSMANITIPDLGKEKFLELHRLADMNQPKLKSVQCNKKISHFLFFFFA